MSSLIILMLVSGVKCNRTLSQLSEEHTQWGDCSWYIVKYVVQCWQSIWGSRYFVTFVKDYSRCCAIHFLKRGDEVPDNSKLFERCAANYSCHNIASLRSNNWGNTCLRNLRATWNQKAILTWTERCCRANEQNSLGVRSINDGSSRTTKQFLDGSQTRKGVIQCLQESMQINKEGTTHGSIHKK